MINDLLSAVVLTEMTVILMILYKNPLRGLIMLILDRVRRGRGKLIFGTVGANGLIFCLVNLYNVMKINRRINESGTVNPTDEVLQTLYLLETQLLGFALFLGLLIYKIYYLMAEPAAPLNKPSSQAASCHKRSKSS